MEVYSISAVHFVPFRSSLIGLRVLGGRAVVVLGSIIINFGQEINGE